MKVYEKHLRSQLAPGGQATCIEIPFFYEGMIQKVVVKQQGGVSVNFQVRIYNSADACQDGSASSLGSDGTGPLGDPELYQVMPILDGTAGEAAMFLSNNGHPFRNMDGTQSVPVRKLYLQIAPEGSGDMTWDIAVGGWSDVG